MQARLLLDIRHHPLGRVRRSLIHDYHQVPGSMMFQHLPKEGDHFLRTDAFLVQLENKPARAIDGGKRRHSSPLARYHLTRCQPTRGPRFAQKGGQRHISFILEIQQSLVFLRGFADFWGNGPHPFLTSFLVHFKVLPLRLLIGQAGIPQTPPDGVARNRSLLFFLDDSMQTTNRPQISLKSKGRGRFKNDFPKSLLVKVFKQTRSAAYPLSLESIHAAFTESGRPTKKSCPIYAIGFGNLPYGHATANSFDSSNPNFKGRILSLVMLFHNQELTVTKAVVSIPDVAELLRRAIPP